MTDKVDTLIWFYNDKGRIKNIKLRNFLNRKNTSAHIFGAQNFFANKKLAIKNNWIARNR